MKDKKMKNLIKLAIISALIFSGFFSSYAGTSLPELKGFVKVSSQNITLGDLLEGLDVGRDIVIAKAPALGKKLTISAKFILTFSKKHNINWRNSRNIKRVTVQNPAKPIRYIDLKNIISKKIKSSIEIYNPYKMIYLPRALSANDLKLSNIKIDRKANKFTVKVIIPQKGTIEKNHILTGHLIKTTMIPFLNKDFHAGQKITSNDILWRAMPTSQISRNMIIKSKDLIGMTPRRRLKSGRVIKITDLKRPTIIKKGAIVSLSFNVRGISLTITGKAIQDGGYGDIIPVMNLKSHKTLQGMIISKNRLRIVTVNSFNNNQLAHLN